MAVLPATFGGQASGLPSLSAAATVSLIGSESLCLYASEIVLITFVLGIPGRTLEHKEIKGQAQYSVGALLLLLFLTTQNKGIVRSLPSQYSSGFFKYSPFSKLLLWRRVVPVISCNNY